MGGGQSSSSPCEDYPGGCYQYEIDKQREREEQEREQERKRAEEAARKAEEDRKRQEEENRRIEAARLKREAEERKRAEEQAAYIKANTPFKKPAAPTLALTNKLSKPCLNCDIVIPPGLSSSTVILSRNILAKRSMIIQRPKEIPFPNKSDLKEAYEKTGWGQLYKNNFLVPSFFTYQKDGKREPNVASAAVIFKEANNPDIPLSMDLGSGTQALKISDGGTKIEYTDRNTWKNIPKFKCAFPNKKFPEVWVDGRPETNEIKTLEEVYNLIDEQNAELEANIVKLNNPKLETILWNPSEKNGDTGAVAVNYKSHGALTKVFLKPTIPFSITYGINADVEKAERKEKERLKKKKEAEDKKKKEEEEAKKAEGK
jgi:hypothetical protein